MMKFPLEDEMIEKIPDPVQREFFKDIKKRMIAGESIDPNQLLDSLSELVGDKNPEAMARLRDLNQKLVEIVKPLQNIKI